MTTDLVRELRSSDGDNVHDLLRRAADALEEADAKFQDAKHIWGAITRETKKKLTDRATSAELSRDEWKAKAEKAAETLRDIIKVGNDDNAKRLAVTEFGSYCGWVKHVVGVTLASLGLASGKEGG